MLKTRVKTGAVLAVIMIAVFYFSYLPYEMAGFAAFLSLLSVWELYHAAGCLENRIAVIASCVLAVVIPFVLPGLACYDSIVLLTLAATVAGFLVLMKKIGTFTFHKSWQAFLVSLTVAILFSTLSKLRSMEYGLHYVTLAILTAAVSDVAAYFVGKSFGKHKLAPRVSPGKTWEGAIGGVVITSFVMLFLAWGLEKIQGVPVRYLPLLGYLIPAVILGQIGDLSMSVLKRSCGIKDFGNLMPGHGGILDRFDSQMYIAPFTLVYFGLLFPN